MLVPSLLCFFAFLATANADAPPLQIVLLDRDVQSSQPTTTVFTNSFFQARLTGLSRIFFAQQHADINSTATETVVLAYETYINEKLIETGRWTPEMFLEQESEPLVASNLRLSQRGRSQITVQVSAVAPNGTAAMQHQEIATVTRSFQAFPSWFALFPVLALAVILRLDRKIQKALFSATLVAACLATGSFSQGSSNIWTVYLIHAIYDLSHSYILVYLIFLSGLLGMMEASGGSQGLTRLITRRLRHHPRTIQLLAVLTGCLIFIDDTVSATVTGELLRSAFDALSTSREKLAWIVHATAGPVTALSPMSVRTGLVVILLQREITRLMSSQLDGQHDLTIPTSGSQLFWESLRYQFYPLFLVLLVILLAATKRDMGPMLLAERKARIYGVTQGCIERTKILPERQQPCRWWNMAVPLLCLVGMRYVYILGDEPSTSLDDRRDLERLLDTMKWALSAAVFLYLFQGVDKAGRLGFFPQMLWRQQQRRRREQQEQSEEVTDKPRVLLSLDMSIQILLQTTGRTFPAIIDLIFVWGTSSAMVDVGLDRLIARWLAGTSVQCFPTMAFILATFLAMGLGNRLSAMTLLLPLVVVPVYESSGGDAQIVYASIGSIFSGIEAGLHLGPVSDILILSCWSSGCHVRAHMVTQLPYILLVIFVSILVGTLPAGIIPYPICIAFGILMVALFVLFLCKRDICESGKLDVMTEAWMERFWPDDLQTLHAATSSFYRRRHSQTRSVTPAVSDLEESSEIESTETISDSEVGSGTDLTETSPKSAAIRANSESLC